MSSPGRFGYLYVALSAVLFAATGTVSKFLFHGGVTPYQLVQIRTVIASAVLLAWLALVFIAGCLFLIVFYRFSIVISDLKDANISLAQRVAILEFHLRALHEK